MGGVGGVSDDPGPQQAGGRGGYILPVRCLDTGGRGGGSSLQIVDTNEAQTFSER